MRGTGQSKIYLQCEHCGRLSRAPRAFTIPRAAKTELPIGPNGGVMLTRRVPGTDEWITEEYRPPGDDRDDFELIEPLIGLKLAAIILGMTPPTLYPRAPSLASSVKVMGRWKFRTPQLYAIDLLGERKFQTRAEEVHEREQRRARGEVLRRGPHLHGCCRAHPGPCPRERRRRPSERDRVTRSILDDLGK